MRLDDRTADREPHAHPVLFRRKKRLEYLVGQFDAWAAIADLGPNRVAHSAHAYPNNPVARHRVHRLHAVADKIDHNLLDLDAIERDKWKAAFDLDIHANASPRRLLGHEVTRIDDHAAERRPVP